MVAPLVIGSLIGAGASLLSGLMSRSGGAAANAASAREAQRNRDFQERMSSTAHRREVYDLRAAGLNPILSARMGASTPGGSMAPQHDVVTPAIDAASRTYSSALQTAMQQAQIKNINANTAATLQGVNIKKPLETGAEAVTTPLKTFATGASRVLESKDFDELGNRLRDVTPRLEGVRNWITDKASDLKEFIEGGALEKGIRSAPNNAAAILRKTKDDVFEVIREGGNQVGKYLESSARALSQKFREEAERHRKEREEFLRQRKQKQ